MKLKCHYTLLAHQLFQVKKYLFIIDQLLRTTLQTQILEWLFEPDIFLLNENIFHRDPSMLLFVVRDPVISGDHYMTNIAKVLLTF
jgi:hypothetical protein